MNDLQEKILVSGNNITKTVYNHSLLAKKTDAAAEKIQVCTKSVCRLFNL